MTPAAFRAAAHAWFRDHRATLQRADEIDYIARFTAEDPAAGLPDAEDLATASEVARDLDLFHPWLLDAAQARAQAEGLGLWRIEGFRCQPKAHRAREC